MPEAVAGDLVVTHFDDQHRAQWLPFARALGSPTAGTPGPRAGEAGRHDQPLQPLGQFRPVEIMQCGGKADMIEPPILVVEPEQQRSDLSRTTFVAEPADDAIG